MRFIWQQQIQGFYLKNYFIKFITREHLFITSPYITYLHFLLPKLPIASSLTFGNQDYSVTSPVCSSVSGQRNQILLMLNVLVVPPLVKIKALGIHPARKIEDLNLSAISYLSNACKSFIIALEFSPLVLIINGNHDSIVRF